MPPGRFACQPSGFRCLVVAPRHEGVGAVKSLPPQNARPFASLIFARGGFGGGGVKWGRRSEVFHCRAGAGLAWRRSSTWQRCARRSGGAPSGAFVARARMLPRSARAWPVAARRRGSMRCAARRECSAVRAAPSSLVHLCAFATMLDSWREKRAREPWHRRGATVCSRLHSGRAAACEDSASRLPED